MQRVAFELELLAFLKHQNILFGLGELSRQLAVFSQQFQDLFLKGFGHLNVVEGCELGIGVVSGT